MSESCAACGRQETARSVCVTDDGGACIVDICGSCVNYLETARCRLCGNRIDADHRHGAYFDGDADSKADRNVCCSCRNGLVRGDGIL